jgi:hypothetical protein
MRVFLAVHTRIVKHIFVGETEGRMHDYWHICALCHKFGEIDPGLFANKQKFDSK